MGKIYKNQKALKLVATVGQDITGATTKQIKYQKPNGDTGYFSAVSSDDANGVLEYTVTSEDDIDQAGYWLFWGYVTFSDEKSAPGEPYEELVYEEGS